MVNSLSDLIYLPADFIVCSGPQAAEMGSPMLTRRDGHLFQCPMMLKAEVIQAVSSFSCGVGWQARSEI